MVFGLLQQMKIPVEYHEEDAKHDWYFWDREIQRFLAADLGKMIMDTKIQLTLHIRHDQEGTYFTLPFNIPEGIGSLTLQYDYDRYGHTQIASEYGAFISEPEINIIDLGLISPDGKQVGASGSDKREFTVSEVSATPGYLPTKLVSGEWKILVGAYKVAESGCDVQYSIDLKKKEQVLLKEICIRIPWLLMAYTR